MWEDKETTAPIPSVAPDGEQPSALARTNSITAFGEPHKRFGKIQTMTMPELMETRFRVRPAVVDGLLPAGTYLLAGAPKIGKSFLVLQMAYQVSMGAPFLGFSSRQGTVLYLALEDTYERLQKRLAQMTEQDSEHLILSVFSETLDEGLLERLTDFWGEHADTVLVIIDTLQRVRCRTPDNGSYAADYDTLARLKEFSDTYGVTVLVVHHTRKEGAEDVFNMISGTNGLMGAADGALLLHKDKRTASGALFQKVVMGILRSLVPKYDKGETVMVYAILRFAKHKGGASKALSAHHERTKEEYASNPDIDAERTKQNYHLVTPRWSYGQEIRHRIRMAGCRVRRDSVKFVETLITTSPEFAKAHESEMPEYFERALGFLKERVGEENIISAVVHMDEKTPHLHLCFVPLTKDGRLSAKEILGNKKRMIQWQDDFYACMSERWPELERGAPAVETKRRHLTPQWYKKVTAMDAKLERLETALNDINVFNAGKKREEAVALLRQLLPEVESFQAEIQRMQEAVSQSLSMQRCSAEENEALKDELTVERRKSAEQRAKLTVLEECYKRAESLLNKVPKKWREFIEKNPIRHAYNLK